MCDFDPKNEGRRMDPCMVERVKRINAGLDGSGATTLASCCGHGKYPATIIVRTKDGLTYDFLSGIVIPRKRRFYRKDAEGVYYIPEVA